MNEEILNGVRERDWAPVIVGGALVVYGWFTGELGLGSHPSVYQILGLVGFIGVFRILLDIKVILIRIFHKLP